MSQTLSRQIVSNQAGPHDRLAETVGRHLSRANQKPIADHTHAAFDTMLGWLTSGNAPLILDACCGVGDSSRHLAHAFRDHRVVGVDKSFKRLSTERKGELPDNLLLLRADLNDLYRLIANHKVPVDRHYILYPNPWPKAAHLSRRWHGAPAFADIVRISGRLELRSNWKLYLEEFQIALKLAGFDAALCAFNPETYITPFEAKYHQSGQALWQLVAQI